MPVIQRHKIIADRYSLHGLWRRRNGYYHARVRDLQTGRTWQFSTKVRSARKAEQFAIRWIEERLRTPESQLRGPNIEHGLSEWLGSRIIATSTRIVSTYRARVVSSAFDGLLVDDVNAKHVECFLKSLGDKGRNARTIKDYLTYLRSFFRWALRNHYCSRDPTDGIRAPRPLKRQPVILTFEQAQRLLQACREPTILQIDSNKRGHWMQRKHPPPHLFLATFIALRTGLRRGNVLGLCWRHIDFEQRVIRIPAEEMKGRADHVIPIHRELLETLWALRSVRNKVDPEDLIVGDVSEFKRSWATATKRAAVRIAFHNLRKTFASWLAEDAPYAVVQAFLGHSLPDVTGLYVKVSLDRMRKAADSLPRLLGEATPAVQHLA